MTRYNPFEEEWGDKLGHGTVEKLAITSPMPICGI
jgi:hypothetical protein